MARSRGKLTARGILVVGALLGSGLGLHSMTPPAGAATSVTVTTTADELNADGDCSLREAVQAVNTGTTVDACPSGSNVIVLPAGSFSLATALTVTAPTKITGAGRIFDSGGIWSSIDGFGGQLLPIAPHLFEVHAGGALTLERLTMQAAATEMISAAAGAGNVVLDTIDTYDGVSRSPAFITVDSAVVATRVAFQNYDTVVGTTDRGSISVYDSTLPNRAACALSAASGSILVEHSLTSALRTTTGPITVRRASVTSSWGGPSGPAPLLGSDTGAITVENSSMSFGGVGLRTAGGISIVHSSTFRGSGPAVQISGPASLTATNSILSCVASPGLRSGGFNITDGTCGFGATGDQVVADPKVTAATIGSARTAAMPIDSGFLPSVGSPAIDRGGNCLAVDQRGFPRPTDGDRDLTRGCDVGAVEVRPLVALAGDWDGNGTDSPGVVARNTFWLRDTSSEGGANWAPKLGGSGTPIAGDWDGDGVDTIGTVQGDVWYLSNSNASPTRADITFKFPMAGGTPVVGDWDGNGTDTPGVVRGSSWSIRNANTSGPATATFGFGSASGQPVVGDWNGDGTDSPGMVDGKIWRIVDGLGTGPVTTFSYGAPGPAVVGDWDGDGRDGPGRAASGTSRIVWFLRNTTTPGLADLRFEYGNLGTY